MLDLKITNARIVDGTGNPPTHGDLGIKDGQIAAVGRVDETASQSLDPGGRSVCPGFIDIHTHYDAQVFWDATLSPSCYHGVTTVIGGNCGFSIAPLASTEADYLMRMLARVEGMPLESLQQGVPWNWRSFGEYLDQFDGKLGVNAGFMVGHSAIRTYVMGDRAVGHQATPDEIAAMVTLLQTSIQEGGLGFSSTISPTHNDGDGQPVPSRHASHEEILALAGAIRDLPGTALEFLPGLGAFSEEVMDLMTRVSLAANRPLNWNVLTPSADNQEMTSAQLAASDYARSRGAEVLALTVPQPISVRLNLHSGFVFDALPGWASLFQQPIEERMKTLRDPKAREKLDRDARGDGTGPLAQLANWAHMRVDETFESKNARLQGRTIGEIAQEAGTTPFDAMLDLSLSEGLRTSFMPPTSGDDAESWAARARSWVDDRTVIGASDAGAHLDLIDTFAFSTQLLGKGVRERGLLSFEEGIRQLTDVPARLYGLKGRGRIREGHHADLVIFDESRIGCGETSPRPDLPGDAGRLYAEAEGIDHVFVSGTEIVHQGEHTGALPGHVLRSGHDTETVGLPYRP
ncbi:MAG: amidohydrolase family protein [Myxococcota bacterium]|nr:amidohydrolase family protein [Myxococcota bacterium]